MVDLQGFINLNSIKISIRSKSNGKMHQIFVTEFVSFVSFAEFVIKPAPVDHEWHEWHELYESHECPAHADVQSPYDLERVQK